MTACISLFNFFHSATLYKTFSLSKFHLETPNPTHPASVEVWVVHGTPPTPGQRPPLVVLFSCGVRGQRLHSLRVRGQHLHALGVRGSSVVVQGGELNGARVVLAHLRRGHHRLVRAELDVRLLAVL